MDMTSTENFPLVSCIVTCYNKIDYLFEAINSVLSQDYPALELIIADDGSQSFPCEEVNSYIVNRKKDNIKKHLVIHQNENIGTVRNINYAISYASGYYIINLDGDDVFYSNTVIRQMIAYMLINKLDLLECSKIRCDKQLNELDLLPTAKEKQRIKKMNTAKKQYHAFAVFLFNNIGGGSGIAYTKGCVHQVGLFDESFRNWQDGPSLIAYVSLGHTIPTNFDIVSIKYRDGGVSNAPTTNKEAFVHISKDHLVFTEKYTIPDVFNPYFFLRRRRVFWYKWDFAQTFFQRVSLMIRYPEQGLRFLIRKICNKAIR